MKLDHSRSRPEEPEHPFQGSMVYQGVQLDIENRKGSIRSGVSDDGVAWSNLMPAHYGEVRNTRGADGDAVDVFVGEDPYAPFVWVIQTKFPGSKRFDETKSMLGFTSRMEAIRCFRRAYSAPGFLLGCTKWPIGAWIEAMKRPHLARGQLKRPLTKGLVLNLRKGSDGRVVATKPGMQLVQSKKNPRVKRWQKTGGDAPGEPQKTTQGITKAPVQFRHPDTGAATQGTVQSTGEKGATIQDEGGSTHKVEHGHYAHPKDSHPAVEMRTELASRENKIRGHSEEHAVIFAGGDWHETGPEYTRKVSNELPSMDIDPKNTCAIPPDIVLAMDQDENAVFSHNHPSGGPFSLTDFQLAISVDLAEMRATTPDGGTWIVKRPEGGWPGFGEYSRVAKEINKSTLSATIRRMDEVIRAHGGTPGTTETKGYSDEVFKGIGGQEQLKGINEGLFKFGIRMEYQTKEGRSVDPGRASAGIHADAVEKAEAKVAEIKAARWKPGSTFTGQSIGDAVQAPVGLVLENNRASVKNIGHRKSKEGSITDWSVWKPVKKQGGKWVPNEEDDLAMSHMEIWEEARAGTREGKPFTIATMKKGEAMRLVVHLQTLQKAITSDSLSVMVPEDLEGEGAPLYWTAPSGAAAKGDKPTKLMVKARKPADYWRTVAGHKVPFSGTPGSGTPLVKMPHERGNGGGKSAKAKIKTRKEPRFITAHSSAGLGGRVNISLGRDGSLSVTSGPGPVHSLELEKRGFYKKPPTNLFPEQTTFILSPEDASRIEDLDRFALNLREEFFRKPSASGLRVAEEAVRNAKGVLQKKKQDAEEHAKASRDFQKREKEKAKQRKKRPAPPSGRGRGRGRGRGKGKGKGKGKKVLFEHFDGRQEFTSDEDAQMLEDMGHGVAR